MCCDLLVMVEMRLMKSIAMWSKGDYARISATILAVIELDGRPINDALYIL